MLERGSHVFWTDTKFTFNNNNNNTRKLNITNDHSSPAAPSPLHLLVNTISLWQRARSNTSQLAKSSSTVPTARPCTAWPWCACPARPASTHSSGPSPWPAAALCLECAAAPVAGEPPCQITVSLDMEAFKRSAKSFGEIKMNWNTKLDIAVAAFASTTCNNISRFSSLQNYAS